MTTSIKTILLLALAMLLGAAVPTNASAQDTNTPPAKEKPAKKSSKSEGKSSSFTSKLGAVDKVAKTITLDEKAKRVLQISSETLITRDGKPAILADGAVGDATSGTFKKSDDGKLMALTVNFGEKPKAASPKPKKSKKPVDASTNAPAPVTTTPPSSPMQTPVMTPPATNTPTP